MNTTVQARTEGAVRILVNSNPQARNAITPHLYDELDLEASLMVESQGDPEAAEGIAAFFEKRTPDFVALGPFE